MGALSIQLDTLLEDVSEIASQSPLNTASAIIATIGDTRRRLAQLEAKLAAAIDHINGDLAMAVRRLKPGLNIGLDRVGCKVGYKTKSLIFAPNLQTGVWEVRSPDPKFLGRFKRHFGSRLALVPDPSQVAKAISDYYTEHYKTLHEEISGVGIVLVEGKRGTLLDIADWRNQYTNLIRQPLPTRRLVSA